MNELKIRKVFEDDEMEEEKPNEIKENKTSKLF